MKKEITNIKEAMTKHYNKIDEMKKDVEKILDITKRLEKLEKIKNLIQFQVRKLGLRTL